MPVTFDVAKELAVGSSLFVYRAALFTFHVVQRRKLAKSMPATRKNPIWYC